MADAPEYVLIPLGSREETLDADEVWRFPTLRRDSWTARVRVTQVGTSVTLKIQGTAWGDDDADYTDLFEKTYTAAADEVVGDGVAWDTAPDLTHAYLRAIVSAADGEYVLEVTAKAKVFDEDALSTNAQAGAQDLLSDDLQSFDDRALIAQRAQRKILHKVFGQDQLGRFTEVDTWRLTRPRSLRIFKEAIALQAEHEFQRYRAMRSDEPADSFLASGSRFPDLAPGIEEIVDPLVEITEDLVWRHR